MQTVRVIEIIEPLARAAAVDRQRQRSHRRIDVRFGARDYDPETGRWTRRSRNTRRTAPADTFTVFAHCTNGGCSDESGQSVSAEEMGKKIERSESFDRSKHKKVRIAGCRVKKDYAQQVKDYLERRGAGKETIEYSEPDQKVYPNAENGNLQQGRTNSHPIKWQTLP